MIVVRYADDLVLGFERCEDAELFLQDFGERLAKFGLELHPEKTRLIELGRYAAANREKRGEGKPDTFDFLGFTHYCGFKKGRFIVWRKTAGKRMRAKLQQLKQELRCRMHEPLAQVGEWLGRVQRGYYQDHAVPGNSATLSRFPDRLFWSRQPPVVGCGQGDGRPARTHNLHEELESLGLVTQPQLWTEKVRSIAQQHNGRWPDDQRCLAGAPIKHDGSGPDVSRADFCWSCLAAQYHHPVDEIASRLMELSVKANSNGELCASHSRECGSRHQARQINGLA